MPVWDIPEHGLTIIGEIDWSDGYYQYDITIVVRDKAGQLYICEDSGCSCPTPFEDFLKISDLGNAVTVAQLQEHLQQRVTTSGDDRSLAIVDIMERVVS